MISLWTNKEAKLFRKNDLSLRVYSSRLLGRNPELVLHGGGNTSVKGKYKNIFGTFGIHPHESKKYTDIDLKFILNLKKKYRKIIGIGETGLDF